MKDYGDKLSAGNRSAIETALTDLRSAHGAKDMDRIESAMNALNAAWQNASQEMYNAANAAGGAGQPGDGNGGPTGNPGGGASDVTDVDYEEVENRK